MKRVIGLVAAAVLLALLVPAAPGGAGLVGTPEVAVFYNASYSRLDPEADQVIAGLEAAGATVTLIEDIAAEDWAAGLDGADVLVIPELVNSEQLGSDLSDDAIEVISSWVEAGGRIVVFGSDPPWASVNTILGTSYEFDAEYEPICNTSDTPTCELTPEGADTEFGDGPASLPYLDDTSNAPTGGFPVGTTFIYQDTVAGLEPAVFVSPIGTGALVFFAFDWFSTVDPDGEALWNEVLAESLAVNASANDTTTTEGSPAVFTISLDERPSQDVVVTYRTADGSAVAGTDYEASSGTVVIPAGSTSATVSVATFARPGDQGVREFTLEIDTPYWGLTATASAVGTIDEASDATTTTTTRAATDVPVAPRFAG